MSELDRQIEKERKRHETRHNERHRTVDIIISEGKLIKLRVKDKP